MGTTLTVCRVVDMCRLFGFDRMFGYGVKYTSGFNDTHLGRIGLKSAGA